MEKIMSENKDIEKTRELTEDELNHVSGGGFGLRANGVEILQFAGGGLTPSGAWNACLGVFGYGPQAT
jgi:bacteriocin-like protein